MPQGETTDSSDTLNDCGYQERFMNPKKLYDQKKRKLDRSFQDVKDFEHHPICISLGWDAAMLRGLIDSNFLGGGYSRKERAYLTSEVYLHLAASERKNVIQRRLEIEEELTNE